MIEMLERLLDKMTTDLRRQTEQTRSVGVSVSDVDRPDAPTGSPGSIMCGTAGTRRRASPMAWAMAAATMLMAPLGAVNAADQLLLPSMSLSGARLSSGVNATGMPLMRPAGAGFQYFIHPVAVAGRGVDTYIADTGADAVFRFDSSLNVMVALSGIRAQKGVQLHVGRDQSLYVLDQAGRRVLHYARSGQLLSTFSDAQSLARPVDVALDETRGRVVVADGMYNQLVAFHAMGGGAQVIPLRNDAAGRVSAIAGMAVGAEGIFLSDPLCACIALVSLDGAVLRTFGHHEVNQPGPIAVDRSQRVFVVDVFDGSLKVFLRGKMIHALTAAELGLRQINDVWIDDDRIILSGGTGASVKILRVTSLPVR